MRIIILTGYSGSGKSTALRFIENLGYYCVDNLPGAMLEDFINLTKKNHNISKVAIVLDARGAHDIKKLDSQLNSISQKHDTNMIFIDTTLESVTKRFKESRLKHPLSIKGSIEDGYKKEAKFLEPFQHKADIIINSSNTNVHSLKTAIKKFILRDSKSGLTVQLNSFGYKYGLPQEADIIIDVRLLANPFYEEKLKKKTGKNTQVKTYIESDKKTIPFIKKTHSYLNYLIKQYESNGKSYINISFGCTGGKHRSVYVAEAIKKLLQKNFHSVKASHRDITME